ncbi:MAG: formylglycine-generating enzyme family protein [Moorea sp. SIO3F7]|nr:formylglycine-generating enzyme family protein [Moorena sp. SIO3E8]NEQ02463.1 formylglycine-generating enzyme family protein [Moorena sp. SIO3F7]
MQYNVTVKGATAFAERFYRALGNKKVLTTSVSMGQDAMGREGNQWYRPVLYLRWSDQEGGQLFGNGQPDSDENKQPDPVRPKTSPKTPIKNPRDTTEIPQTKGQDEEEGLKQFSFEVVTVNRRGAIIKRENKQESYFTEHLGNAVDIEMVYIPAGSFSMGSPETEKGSDDRQRPQHQVSIKPFFLGKYQVTQAQWGAVAKLPKVNRELKPDPSRFKGEKRPVEQVSWYDAVEFCDRLSEYTGTKYRLPSEAEWEYACRAGTTTPFHYGETITSKLANYDASNTYAEEAEGEYRRETTPVGGFPPNGFGLYDMHGNVWEWCGDPYHRNYKGAPTDGSIWSVNDNKDDSQWLRGGSWYDNPRNCRSASRVSFFARDNFHNDIGFRVARGVGRT